MAPVKDLIIRNYEYMNFERFKQCFHYSSDATRFATSDSGNCAVTSDAAWPSLVADSAHCGRFPAARNDRQWPPTACRATPSDAACFPSASATSTRRPTGVA